MKKLAIIIALAGLIGTPAFAADLSKPLYKAPPPPPAPVFSWTGWYVGLNAGGGWGSGGIHNSATSFCTPNIGGCSSTGAVLGYDVATARAVPLSFDSKLRGFIGGGQIGYNWQEGVTVWGIEADFQGAYLKGSANAANTQLANTGIGPEFVTVLSTGSQKLDFLGTLRGRLGWVPNGPWLVYATGGLAYGHTETSASFVEIASLSSAFDASSAASVNAWRAGWTIGGGFEWMIAPHWSIKGEYLYYDLGKVTVNNTITASFFGANVVSEAAYRGSIARAGINRHF